MKLPCTKAFYSTHCLFPHALGKEPYALFLQEGNTAVLIAFLSKKQKIHTPVQAFTNVQGRKVACGKNNNQVNQSDKHLPKW